ncbi:hypothetical protein [Erysipelothrix anatis]|uniref:hypothetical protein n=1 Tax=Erysipelothrix anatis TaxID=2683713 RepID=UPI00140E9191|nr:hypothetical protein [Erysipelothrix anatis]
MNKLFKLCSVSLLSFFLLLVMVIPVSAEGKITDELITASEHSEGVRFVIKNSGEEIEIIHAKDDSYVKVAGYKYSPEDYLEAVTEQSLDNSQYPITTYLSNYSQIFVEDVVAPEVESRQMAQAYWDVIPPTTGYRADRFIGVVNTSHNQNIAFIGTSAGLTTAITKLSSIGQLSVAAIKAAFTLTFVKAVLVAAVAAGVVASVVGKYLAPVKTNKWEALHSAAPAAKNTWQMITYVGNQSFTGSKYYTYYYYANPGY